MKSMLKTAALFVGLATVVFTVAASALESGHPAMLLLAVAAAPFAAQTKILAISGAVYGVLQLVKKVVPIQGWLSIALNVGLSVLGVVTVVQPQDLYSTGTAVSILTAAAAAAGVHGTVKNMSAG